MQFYSLFTVTLHYGFLSGLWVDMTTALFHLSFISLGESYNDNQFIPGKMQGKEFDAQKTRTMPSL